MLQKAQKGDESAKAALVEGNLRLIISIVGRFRDSGKEREDLIQIGAIGLIKAINRFDHARGVAFSTYAVPMIMGEIRRYLRDDGTVHLNRSLKEQASMIRQAREKWFSESGQEPSVAQLAAHLELSEEKIVETLESMQQVVSLFAPTGQDNLLLDNLLRCEDQAETVHFKLLLEQLPQRLYKIIYWRYFLDQTQAQVAEQLNISQVQVSRLEKQALILCKDLWEKEDRSG